MLLSCEPLQNIHPNCKARGPYEFIVPITTIKSSEHLKVGDTISVVFDFGNEFVDQNDKKTYVLDDYSFQPLFLFYRINEVGEKDKFYFNFSDTINMQAKWLDINHEPNSTFQFAYIGFDYFYDQKRYKAKFSFIIKQQGIYYFEFKEATPIELGGAFEGKCHLRNVRILFRQETDGNFELIKNIFSPICKMDSSCYDEFKDEFIDYGGYAFDVK